MWEMVTWFIFLNSCWKSYTQSWAIGWNAIGWYSQYLSLDYISAIIKLCHFKLETSTGSVSSDRKSESLLAFLSPWFYVIWKVIGFFPPWIKSLLSLGRAFIMVSMKSSKKKIQWGNILEFILNHTL